MGGVGADAVAHILAQIEDELATIVYSRQCRRGRRWDDCGHIRWWAGGSQMEVCCAADHDGRDGIVNCGPDSDTPGFNRSGVDTDRRSNLQ